MHYVSGLETRWEVFSFEPFLRNNSYRLQWPYSNPNYTVQYEVFVNASKVMRYLHMSGGKGYYARQNASYSGYSITYQGGYRCSIRAYTEWENKHYVAPGPIFYSIYMDSEVQEDGLVYAYWKSKCATIESTQLM
jgi:hypothetical protein